MSSSSPNNHNGNLIWIDLEMTGLDPDNDHIIEIATIITDSDIKIIAEGPVIAIHQPQQILQSMDQWNIEHHIQSGLVKRVQESRYSVIDAERQTLAFLRQYVAVQTSPMCGNSICQDRRFLYRLMPELEQYFHYHNLDVSSVKEMVRRWYPERPQFSKQSSHQALQDIRDSIAELQFYRQHYFINT